MAGPFTGLLDQLGNGFLRPKGQMGDWQHAARTFVDDNFRLAPKAKFLYHVYFDINRSAVFMPALTERHRNEIGLLVKSVDLPKFSIRSQTVNQYNRKKVVQTGHSYGPMTFRFHDDRADIVNMMWQAYYRYYYADTTTAEIAGAYLRNSMSSFSKIKGAHGYDNNSSIPFFNSIYLYQLNKRNYVSYKLINPLITTFNHDTPSSSDQGATGAECSMTVSYEAVTYDSGPISSGKVLGFNDEHYDKSPSPLSAAGGGTSTLFGQGGVIEGAANIFGAISSGNAFNSLPNIINTAATAVNTYQNAKNLKGSTIKAEARNLAVAGTVAAAGAAFNVIGTAFPSTSLSTATKAIRRDIGGGG